MSKFDYEKNNAVTTLKNEKFGLEQLISDLKKLKQCNFNSIEGKIINVKVEKVLKESIDGYLSLCIGYDNINKISVIVKERYNIDTRGYIGFYDTYKIDLGYNKSLKDGMHEQRRFDTFKTLESIEKEIIYLENQLKRINSDLENIDNIITEIQEIYSKVQNFKKDKTGFLLDCFRDLNGFY